MLAIVNEVYFRNTRKNPDWAEGRKRLQSKMHLVLDDPALADFRVAEYGTRRRFSKVWHEEIAVSYTHLDVYKRQGRKRPRRWR